MKQKNQDELSEEKYLKWRKNFNDCKANWQASFKGNLIQKMKLNQQMLSENVYVIKAIWTSYI